ncbi:GNAT family N-acetyltransferase [Planococcus sp. YIM B11945]|uniref:GNAT family N-acetyltransferase n=1 Tax=Planococcus sp. YIM B11945 TaxID=3435410 RepID=UPI003D7E5D86
MYEVVSVHHQVQWQKIMDLFQIKEIFYTAPYCLSAIKLDPGEPLLFYYSDEDGEVAYPFIKRHINEGAVSCFDITTPFGYGGPVVKIKQDSFKLIENFRKAFTEFCREEKIIAEYIRFHPLKENALFFEKHLKLMQVYDTYTINLQQRSPFPLEVKENKKNDLTSSIEKDVVVKKLGTVRHMFDFLVLYYSSARRREEADSYYFFTDDYFESLISSIGPNLHLFGAYYKDKLMSACYVLAKGDTIFYHLDGSLNEQEAVPATQCLLLKIAEWGKENQFDFFHLGGDLHPENGQGRKIKQEISNMKPSTFFIGHYVHDVPTYNKVIAAQDADIIKRYRNG